MYVIWFSSLETREETCELSVQIKIMRDYQFLGPNNKEARKREPFTAAPWIHSKEEKLGKRGKEKKGKYGFVCNASISSQMLYHVFHLRATIKKDSLSY